MKESLAVPEILRKFFFLKIIIFLLISQSNLKKNTSKKSFGPICLHMVLPGLLLCKFCDMNEAKNQLWFTAVTLQTSELTLSKTKKSKSKKSYVWHLQKIKKKHIYIWHITLLVPAFHLSINGWKEYINVAILYARALHNNVIFI